MNYPLHIVNFINSTLIVFVFLSIFSCKRIKTDVYDEDEVATPNHEIASQLLFPEGPIPLSDGSILVVEMARGTLTNISPDGVVTEVSKLGGGPNGAAIGPDGAVYICNNGGLKWIERENMLIPGEAADDYKHGSIQRVHLETKDTETVYTHCNGRRLSAPNDIVFDKKGGMWFTDQGKYFSEYKEHGAIYYAKPDGSYISLQADNLESPNGIGLSPDEKYLYYAETTTGRLYSYEIKDTGKLKQESKKLIVGLPGNQMFDSLSLDIKGNIYVATLINGGITIISPQGEILGHIATGDFLTTSISFLSKKAYITLGATGKLVSIELKNEGLPVNF